MNDRYDKTLPGMTFSWDRDLVNGTDIAPIVRSNRSQPASEASDLLFYKRQAEERCSSFTYDEVVNDLVRCAGACNRATEIKYNSSLPYEHKLDAISTLVVESPRFEALRRRKEQILENAYGSRRDPLPDHMNTTKLVAIVDALPAQVPTEPPLEWRDYGNGWGSYLGGWRLYVDARDPGQWSITVSGSAWTAMCVFDGRRPAPEAKAFAEKFVRLLMR